jgi:CRISPR/Cas system-associated endoribonuclease Cas2
MATYLITYDLNNPGQRHSQILKAIKEYSWARLSESSYAIETTASPQQVFNSLSNNLDKNDNLYVINLSRPYYGQGPQDVNNWLASKLR